MFILKKETGTNMTQIMIIIMRERNKCTYLKIYISKFNYSTLLFLRQP